MEQDQLIRSIFDTKASCIFKNAMSKVRHGQDKGTWIPQLVRATLDQHWSSTEFQNKSAIAKANRAVEKGASAYCGGSISTAAHFEKMTKELERQPTAWEVVERTKKLKTGQWVNDKTRDLAEKYKKRREEAQQQQMLESASSQNSHVASIDDNEIYIDVVVSGNKKGNVYGLGVLSKRFNSSTSAHSAASQAPVVHQIEEMREIIQKLNDELMTKRVKERTLEEKMELLMKTHEEQSERMRKQDEKMQLILQHIQMNNPASGSSDPTTSGHHKGDQSRDDSSEED
ncbi:uncharacterized protein [Phaseolus vulgaris]|uniref:uncharacterized protein n=1 Tax=Phaseolus vulgaris TaxID=3885 RepID=UPI0035CC546D